MRQIVIIEYTSQPVIEETRITFSDGGKRRRTTVPKSVCDALNVIKTGDKIKWIILDKEVIVMRSKN